MQRNADKRSDQQMLAVPAVSPNARVHVEKVVF